MNSNPAVRNSARYDLHGVLEDLALLRDLQELRGQREAGSVEFTSIGRAGLNVCDRGWRPTSGFERHVLLGAGRRPSRGIARLDASAAASGAIGLGDISFG